MTSELEYNDDTGSSSRDSIGGINENIIDSISAIAYNGSTWLMGGNGTIRRTVRYTYPEVQNLLNSVEDYEVAIRVYTNAKLDAQARQRLTGINNETTFISEAETQINAYNVKKNILLSQAQAVYSRLKALNVTTTLYQVFTSHPLAISKNGLDWTLVDYNPFHLEHRTNQKDLSFFPREVSGISWTGTNWIAVGKCYFTWTGTAFSSSNTINLTRRSQLSEPLLSLLPFTYFNNANDSNTSTIKNCLNIISTSPDGINWTHRGIPGRFYQALFASNQSDAPYANGIASSSGLSIVVGKNFYYPVEGQTFPLKSTISKSSDNGETWDVVTSIGGMTDEAYGVAYNGSIWVVVGRKTFSGDTCLVTSPNGTTWTSRISHTQLSTATILLSVAWNGSIWMAVGFEGSSFLFAPSDKGVIYTSEDGVTWVKIIRDFNSLYSVTWDGSFWNIAGVNGVYVSKDTIVWDFKKLNPSETTSVITSAISSDIPLPVLGGTIKVVDSLMVGYGSPMSALRSYGADNWIPTILDDTGKNYLGSPQKEFTSVLWTGSYWLIGGFPQEGYVGRNLAKSVDGIDWTFPANDLFKTNSIAKNSSLIVAVGESGWRKPSSDIVITSTNGDNWAARASPLTAGYFVAWNGSKWVIGGDGIAYSTDGINWQKSQECPLALVYTVAWNGYIWVAGGVGKTTCIALSIDGIRWYAVDKNSNLFTECRSVAWNKTNWVAVGSGVKDTIAFSTNGYNWTGIGRTVFPSEGTFVGWDGSKWIASGVGTDNPLATSTNSITWDTYTTSVSKVNCIANKEVVLPYTGVSSDAVLTSINSAISLITGLTDATILDEQAAAQLAADQAAAAAAAAAIVAERNAAIHTSSGYRVKILYWTKYISEVFQPLLNKTDVDLSEEKPVEFLNSKYLYDFMIEKTSLIDGYYRTILDSSSTITLINVNLQNMLDIITFLESNLVLFYNNARVLYKSLVDGRYAKYITDIDTVNILTNFGYTTTKRNAAIAQYNTIKDLLDPQVASAISIFNTSLSSISYSISISTSSLTQTNLTLSYFTLDSYVGNNISNGTILSKITSNRPSYNTDYSGITQFTNMISFTSIITRNHTYKQQADALKATALANANLWASVFDTGDPTQEVNDAFQPYYNKYFLSPETLNPSIASQIPYSDYFHLGFDYKLGTYRYAADRAIPYCKIVSEDFSHPAYYIAEFTELYNILKDKLDEADAVRLAAINYARNLRNTTVETKLLEFIDVTKTKYTGTLGIEAHLLNLVNICYYSNSLYIKARDFSRLIRFAYGIYPTLFSLIRAVKFADAEAEDDGAVPPVTGWGGSLEGLDSSQIGSQGLSGWVKANETTYARNRLNNFIENEVTAPNRRDLLKPLVTNGIIDNFSINTVDFFTFTNTITYEKLNDMITEFNTAIDTLNSNQAFSQTVMNGIASTDVTNIQAQVVSAATTYIDGLLASVSANIPSSQDVADFGYWSFNIGYPGQTGDFFDPTIINANTTFSQMVDILNENFTDLETAADVVLTGKTNTEIKTLVENAVDYKEIVDEVQSHPLYITVIQGIPFYRTAVTKATQLVELMADDMSRWLQMKQNAINNSPFPIYGINSGEGNDFIVTIPPTNTHHWTERKYTSYLNLDGTYGEPVFNSQTNTLTILPALTATDYPAYSATQKYVKYNYVTSGGFIYQCIKDNTDPNSTGIRNVSPYTESRWKLLTYPEVYINGRVVEGSPEDIKQIDAADVDPYTINKKYYYNDYIKSGGNIYRCMKDFTGTKKLKGISPANSSYWIQKTHPFGILDGVRKEIIPSQYSALDITTISEHSITAVYKRGDYVKVGSTIRFLIIAEGIIVQGDLSVAGSKGGFWLIVTHPVALVDSPSGATFKEIKSSEISPLELSSFGEYSATTEYKNQNSVKFNNLIYECAIGDGGVVGIDVSNDQFWKAVLYPYVSYEGDEFEATPSQLNALRDDVFNSTNYSEYSSTKTYNLGDTVSFNGSYFECTDDTPYQVEISGIPLTATNYWAKRTYPMVILKNIGEVEADPANGLFVQLHEKNYHRYNKSWLYQVGDFVSYGAKVYECINTNPVDLDDTFIVNIPPSDGSYWRETIVNIPYNAWQSNKQYAVGTFVTYNGNIYRCETTALGLNPEIDAYLWRKILDLSEVNLPKFYSITEEYNIGEKAAVRRLTNPITDTYSLTFYECYRTQEDSPSLYTFDEVAILDEVDSSGSYKTGIIRGTWDKLIPRYGSGYETDPFRLQGFAGELRRRFAMEVQIPYHILRWKKFAIDKLLMTYKYRFENFNVKAQNAVTLFNSLRNTVNEISNTFDVNENAITIQELTLRAYGDVVSYLKETVYGTVSQPNETRDDISYLAEKIKTIKTQYFNLPPVQKRIYDNPYEYINPVGLIPGPPLEVGGTPVPPKKLFRDLGVGDINEIEYAIDVQRNQLKYTEYERQYYYTNTERLEVLEDSIARKLLAIKLLVGYQILFAMNGSSNLQGGRLYLQVDDIEFDDTRYILQQTSEGEGNPLIYIDVPITDFRTLGPLARLKSPDASDLIEIIHQAMIESIKPPEYMLGPSPLLQALTYESKNPDLGRLGNLAKGLVGFATAVFKDAVDPWAMFGAIEFVGQVVTNDYETKILTFVPEGKWPDFKERSQNITLLKRRVDIIRNSIVNNSNTYVYNRSEVADFLMTVGKLLLMNSVDLSAARTLARTDTFTLSRSETRSISRYTPPSQRPPNYVPPQLPSKPIPKTSLAYGNLFLERQELLSLRLRLVNQLAVIDRKPPVMPELPTNPVQKAVGEVKSVTSGKNYKFGDLDRAALNSRGAFTARTQAPQNFSRPQETPGATIVQKPVNVDEIAAVELKRKTMEAEFKAAEADFNTRMAKVKQIELELSDVRVNLDDNIKLINDVDMKNIQIAASNAEDLKIYTSDIEAQEALNDIKKNKAFRAQAEYDAKLAEYKSSRLSSSVDVRIELDNLRLQVITTKIEYDGAVEILTEKIDTFERQLVNHPSFSNIVKSRLPPALVARYNQITDFTTSLTSAVELKFRTLIRSMSKAVVSRINYAEFIAKRPALKPFFDNFKIPKSLNRPRTSSKKVDVNGNVIDKPSKASRIIGALGPIMEIAGIGMTMWADGVFDESATLD